jgi:glycosyltransferase involved in cell wall biosynthesis
MIKVTLGLCVKNVEKTIADAMDSILKQDFPTENMELIIVDGFSNDGTLEIIEKYLRQLNIKFAVFKEKKGLGFARQLVVERAKGKYIIYVDGDMIMARDFVAKQVKFMEKNPKIGMAIGKFQVPSKKVNWIENLENILWITEDKLFDNVTLSKTLRSTVCGAIFRTEALKQAGGFDPRIKGAGEDMDVYIKTRKIGWLLYSTTDALFCDRRKDNLRSLWRENFWYGYGGHYILHKHKNNGVIRPSRFFYFIKVYKMTKQKIAFLLPLIYFFEKFAWGMGYMRAHLDNYGHE